MDLLDFNDFLGYLWDFPSQISFSDFPGQYKPDIRIYKEKKKPDFFTFQ